jgi:Lar family restriction alleviation protein
MTTTHETPAAIDVDAVGTLKPCPFCGSTSQTLIGPTRDKSTIHGPNGRAYPIILCGGCSADVPGEDFDTEGRSAIEAWNRRAADPALLSERDSLKEEVERLREALGDLMTWFPEQPSPPEWRLKAGEHGVDEAVTFARAALKGDAI